MIRGAKKQMIVLHTGNSPYFDAAYFILKNKQAKEKTSSGDILAEANRILSENQPSKPALCIGTRRVRVFLLGTLCGAILCAVVLLPILLF